MKYDKFYMDVAERIAQESYATRLKVGSAILTENGGLFVGFNGTLPGFINTCEKEDGSTDESITSHAEQNSLYKMLKEGVSAKGATIYLTHSPCLNCSLKIVAAKIQKVYYRHEYRCSEGIEWLKKNGVLVYKV